MNKHHKCEAMKEADFRGSIFYDTDGWYFSMDTSPYHDADHIRFCPFCGAALEKEGENAAE